MTMSTLGNVIQATNVYNPDYLSVSTANAIYLISSYITRIYQSTDDGLTWSHIYDVCDDWACGQAIIVSTDSETDVLWAIVRPAWGLRVYTVDKRQPAGNNVTWQNVTVPSHMTFDSRLSELAYDGHSNIFVTDYNNRAVHVWSVSGQYVCQLVSPQQLSFRPYHVAVDTQRHVMYVGQNNGKVGVIELKCEPI
jgi:hypothetical protein